jgi:ketosteroid isomerase-like protein
MSQGNVELAQRCFEAYNRRDIEALRSLYDADVEQDWSASRGVEAGVYRGLDSVLRFYSGYLDAFDEIVFEAERFIEAGESVVVPNVAQGRGRKGIEVLARSAVVMTFRGQRSRTSASTRRRPKPSKPWGWRGRRCRRRAHDAVGVTRDG